MRGRIALAQLPIPDCFESVAKSSGQLVVSRLRVHNSECLQRPRLSNAGRRKSLESEFPSAHLTRVAALAKRILVVDDDVVILRLVRESMAALLPCEIDSTPSPEYAFELILKKPYDLMIFDFSMPGIDGAVLYGLISKLFEIHPPRGQRLPPMILMSGLASQKRAQELLRQPGVRGLLAKPFSIEKLVQKVSEIILPERTP